MSQQEELIESFGTTYWLIGKFSDGMSHEDSVATPSFRTNSFNWVFGHILVSRDRALTLLGKETTLTAEERTLYETGSGPLSPESAVKLNRLLTALDASQERISKGLSAASDEDLAAIFDESRNVTVGSRIAGLHWHETYHVGQLEILRQVNVEREAFP
ncbi:MAG: DinB family protein [Candidatus Promineifilaceae bacterium]|nr:DinB family protein [Candidatus Promineifilaceae bacterium]